MKYIINIDLTNPIYANDREAEYVDNDTGMKWTISKTGLKKMKPLEEQIIRCKDCTYRDGDYCHRFYDGYSAFIHHDDFCNYAERREGDGEADG